MTESITGRPPALAVPGPRRRVVAFDLNVAQPAVTEDPLESWAFTPTTPWQYPSATRNATFAADADTIRTTQGVPVVDDPNAAW